MQNSSPLELPDHGIGWRTQWFPGEPMAISRRVRLQPEQIVTHEQPDEARRRNPGEKGGEDQAKYRAGSDRRGHFGTQVCMVCRGCGCSCHLRYGERVHYSNRPEGA
jgi:hypothetical protein